MNRLDKKRNTFSGRVTMSGHILPSVGGGGGFGDAPANPLIPKNNPQKQIDNYTARLNTAGLDVPEPDKPRLGNALMSVLEKLNRPKSMITNSILEVTNPEKYEGGVGSAMKRGITGQQQSFFSDILDEGGWKKQHNPQGKWYNPATWNINNTLHNTVGLAGDILLDPITYLSAGTMTAGKGLLSKAGGTAARELGESAVVRSADELSTRLATTLGTTADDILQRTRKHGANANIIMEAAESLAKNPEDINKILDRGLDGINMDTITKGEDDLTERLLNLTASGKQGVIKQAGKSRKLSQQSFLPGLEKGQYSVSNLIKNDPTKAEDFVKRITSIFDHADRVPLNIPQKKSMLKRVYGGNFEDDLLDAFDDKNLQVLDTLLATFGKDVDGLAGLTARADKITKAMKTSSGEWRDLTSWADKARTEIIHRNTAKGVERGIKFANGLEHVYNTATKSFHLKYLGKPIFDITNSAIAKGMKAAGDAALKVTPLRKMVDGLGFLFDTEHVRQSLRLASPELYEAAKSVTKVVTKYLQRETGMPHHALNATANAFNPAFLQNPALDKLGFFFVTGAYEGADDAAKRRWASELASFSAGKTPQQIDGAMNLVREAANTNTFLNEAYYMLDEATLEGDSLFRKELGEMYENIGFDHYARSLLKGDPEEIMMKMAGSSEKVQESIAFSKQATHMHKRKFASVAQAEEVTEGALQYVPSLVTAASVRYLDSLRVGLNRSLRNELLKGLKHTPGLDKIVTAKESVAKRYGLHRIENLDLYVSDDIAHQLKRISNVVNDDLGQAYLVGLWDKATNYLKTVQTRLSPAFVMRNAMGETLMNFMAGVSLKSHDLATQVMKDASHQRITQIGNTVMFDGKPMVRLVWGKLDETQPEKWLVEFGEAYKGGGALAAASGWGGVGHRIDMASIGISFDDVVREQLKELGVKTYSIGGKEMTAHEIMTIFRDKGLGWSGVTKGNIIEDVQSTLQREVLKKTHKPGIRKAVSMLGEIGDGTETWTRMAHLLDRLDNGYGIDDAVLDVKQYHVDYRDLTPTERNLFRRVAPYYTYMRKNTPIQLRNMIANPGKNNMVFSLIRQSHENLERHQGSPVVMPDYLKEGLALPLGVDDEGNIQYLNWNLPLTDINRVKYDFNEFMKKNVLDMLHPFVKAPFEWSYNQDGFGQPVQRYEGETAPLFSGQEGGLNIPKPIDYMLQQAGVIQQARNTLGQTANNMAGVPEDPLKPDQVPMLGSILPIKNQQSVANSQAFKYRDQLQQYIQMLSNEQNVIVPPLERKQNFSVRTPTRIRNHIKNSPFS